MCGSRVSGSLAAMLRTFFFWASAAGGPARAHEADGQEQREDGDGPEREP